VSPSHSRSNRDLIRLDCKKAKKREKDLVSNKAVQQKSKRNQLHGFGESGESCSAGRAKTRTKGRRVHGRGGQQKTTKAVFVCEVVIERMIRTKGELRAWFKIGQWIKVTKQKDKLIN
jgi:hypothetical protein